MRVFYGSLGKRDALSKIKAEGDGRLITAADWKNPYDKDPKHPVNGLPWCLDNGAFTSYNEWLERKKRGEPVGSTHTFDGEALLRSLAKLHVAIEQPGAQGPEFVVLPDIVEGGRQSLKLSRAALQVLPDNWSYYLSVQDGLKPKVLDEPFYDVLADQHGKLREFIWGVFVGGSMDWKLKSEYWPKEAHDRGLKCHYGRITTFQNLVHVRRLDADSCDSMGFYRSGRHGRPNKQHYVPSSRAQRFITEVV